VLEGSQCIAQSKSMDGRKAPKTPVCNDESGGVWLGKASAADKYMEKNSIVPLWYKLTKVGSGIPCTWARRRCNVAQRGNNKVQ
jgi:hypothetical protein